MNALGEWLKQLVLIVMLAVFADMLLPTRAMQRYVRIVMGLAIIAAMLQPLVPLLKRDWADQAASLATSETSNVAVGPGTDSAEANALQQTIANQTKQAANDLLAEQIKEEVEQQWKCQVSDVLVKGNAVDGSLHVMLSTGPLTAQQRAAVRQKLSIELDIPSANVVVRAL